MEGRIIMKFLIEPSWSGSKVPRNPGHSMSPHPVKNQQRGRLALDGSNMFQLICDQNFSSLGNWPVVPIHMLSQV